MSATIIIPARCRNTPDATLYVDAYDLDTYVMTLLSGHDEHVIADATGFRPGAAHHFGSEPENVAHTVGTFARFLAAAIESRHHAQRTGHAPTEDASESWNVLADDVDEWADALTLYATELEGLKLDGTTVSLEERFIDAQDAYCGEHYGRVPSTREKIGPYDTAAELAHEIAAAEREAKGN